MHPAAIALIITGPILIVVSVLFLIAVHRRPSTPCYFANDYVEAPYGTETLVIGADPCNGPAQFTYVSLTEASNHVDEARSCSAHSEDLRRLAGVHTGFWRVPK